MASIPDSIAKLAMRLEANMQRAYCQRHARIFYPVAFVERDVGSEECVMLAFGKLQQDHKLQLRGVVKCEMGHVVWDGPLEEAVQFLDDPCQRCDIGDSEENSLYVRAVLSQDWTAALDSLCEPEGQKKSSARVK
jgi:hypothetical protein